MGNVTSQLFANIYLHELDLFVKETLKQKYYLRFSDDFLFLSTDKKELLELIPIMRLFLKERLHLDLHPKKTSVRSFDQGIDFVGYVLRPYHQLLRTRTKKRLKNRLRKK